MATDLVIQAHISTTKLRYREDEIVHDALKIFFSVNKEMREHIAIELYECAEISVGKACEIADTSYENMKNLLYKNNVLVRRGPASAEELKAKAKKLADLL
ncbi:MAG: UPF0175 family protein [Euryarchaeota archaeon]|nr:UPF0175 family protein [Euryarchaeota archaeon]